MTINFICNIGIELPQCAQKATLPLQNAGDSFTSTEGTIEIADGQVDGESIR